MKTTSLLVLTLCAGLPGLAQTPVTPPPQTPALSFNIAKDTNLTFYGVLDVAVGRVDHSLNFDAYFPATTNPTGTKYGATAATGMISGGISAPRLGVRGYTDLGDGWKAIMNLESSIMTTNGSLSNAASSLATNKATGPTVAYDVALSGQLFGRACWFGVSSDTYGTLTVGRNLSMLFDAVGIFDPVQAAQMFSPIGFSGSYAGGGATDDSRTDNSAKYRIKVGDFNAGVLYKLGGVSGAATAQTSFQANLGFERGPLNIQGYYQGFKDAMSLGNPSGTGTQPLGTVTLTSYDTKAWMLGVKYAITPGFILRAGNQLMHFANPSNPTKDAQITSIFGQVVNSVNTTAYSSGSKSLNISWLGAAYDVTKKFNISAGYYFLTQNDYSGGAATPSAKSSGNSKFYCLLLDYHFSKKFDAYAGYMDNQMNGGLSFGYINNNNSITALGMRYSF